MGLFSNSKEDQLVEVYEQSLVASGISSSEASETAKEILNQAKESLVRSGEDRLPENFGDIILTNPKFKKNLEKARKDGVTDKDVQEWFNMDPLERHMVIKMDELNKISLFVGLLKDGKSEEYAMSIVDKYHPNFGDPEDLSKFSGEDRLLPEELKGRINRYIEKRAMTDPEQYKNDIEKSTSFNALVRKEIKAGKL